MRYQIGALNEKALELMEKKGWEKCTFETYQKAFTFADKVNQWLKCYGFRVINERVERKGL